MRTRAFGLVAAIAAGLILSGAGVANASGVPVASDNQVFIPIDLPVGICGVSAAVLGVAESGCEGGSAVIAAPHAASGGYTGTETGIVSVGSGNRVSAPISAPIQVCGISVAVLGSARSGCRGGAVVVKPRKPCGRHRIHLVKKPLPPVKTILASGMLPTTGVDMIGLVAGGLGFLGAGVGACILTRRRHYPSHK